MALDSQEMEFLRFQREQLREAALDPLQRIKTAIGRGLRRQEVRHMKSLLTREIRNETLAKIIDGESLLAVLDMYYGRDNLRFLERLLYKADCHDLIEMLQDWKNTGNSLNPTLFEEFGYFPLWIKVKSTFMEFSSQRRHILNTLKDVFAIPMIEGDDPDLDPLIYMGVSLGKRDVLFCTLIPECARQHIKASLQYKEVVAMLEEANIIGIYFSRRKRVSSNSSRLSSSRSSLSSCNGSAMSDFGQLGDAVFEVANQNKYNEKRGQVQRTSPYIDYTINEQDELQKKCEMKITDQDFIKKEREVSELVTSSYGVMDSVEGNSHFKKYPEEKTKKDTYGTCFFVDYRKPQQVHQTIISPEESEGCRVENVNDSLQSHSSDFTSKLPQPEPEINTFYDIKPNKYQEMYSTNADKWRGEEIKPQYETKHHRQPNQVMESLPPAPTGNNTTGKPEDGRYSPNELPPYYTYDQQVRPSLYREYRGDRVNVQEGNPRQSIIFMQQDDTEPRTDNEDAIFPYSSNRRLDSQGERDSVKFNISPPPYNPPPGYDDSIKRKSRMSLSISSLDSRGSRGRGCRSPLLSAQSIGSIYREKEMFLSTDELNESIKFAEEREWEKYFERSRDLLAAAKIGDENEVNMLIDEGVDVNYQNEFGHTALMIASREGHLNTVEVLLAADADVNMQEKYGKSALHEAAWSGQYRVIHCLISGDANVNIMDEEQRTPLQYATLRGKARVVEVLLLFGADVSIKNMVGESAVEIAYWCGYSDIVQLLLSSNDKKKRKEMQRQIRKQKLERIKSATSLPNLNKSVSLKDLARSRSRPDLNKKSACVIQ